MDSLNQRLAARCYLTPLSLQETGEYVRHKIELSGVDSATVMTRDSLEAIYRGSDGIPRLIDQLVDQSLMLACNDRERPVSASMVGRAWCMLQQLPNPWSEPDSITKPAMDENLVASGRTKTFATSQTNFLQAFTPTVAYSNETPSSSSSMTKSNSAVSNSAVVSVAVPAAISSIARPADDDIEYGFLEDEPVSIAAKSADFGWAESSLSLLQQNAIDSDAVQGARTNAALGASGLLDAFAGDFDEEFSIPVQSSGSYKAYSGAAYGNLNYDLSSFGTVHDPLASQQVQIEEANEFLSNPFLHLPQTDLNDRDFNADEAGQAGLVQLV